MGTGLRGEVHFGTDTLHQSNLLLQPGVPIKNIVWKSPIPGRGHGSLSVVGRPDFSANSGRENGLPVRHMHRSQVGQASCGTRWSMRTGGMRKMKGRLPPPVHPHCDGNPRLCELPEQRCVGDFGPGPSRKDRFGKPKYVTISNTKVTAHPLVCINRWYLISADNKAGGAIAGLDRKQGKIVWKVDRPKLPNYPSPVVIRSHGQDQLIMTGCDTVSSYKPINGQLLWETKGATTDLCYFQLSPMEHECFRCGG